MLDKDTRQALGDIKNAALPPEISIPENLGNIYDVWQALGSLKFEVLPTGKPVIDNQKLFIRGAVTRIGAFSNVGKSRFAYWITHEFLRQGHKGMIFSTEVVKPIVLANMLQIQKNWAFWDIVRHKVQPTKEDIKLYGDLGIYDSMDTLNRLDVVLEMVRRYKPDFFVVDFLQGMRPTDGSGDRYEMLTNYAFEIQRAAQEIGCSVIDLSQIPNDDAKRLHGTKDARKRRDAINFKGSGDLFSSADIALALDRFKEDEFDEDEEGIDASEMRIWVKKHKYFPCGNLTLWCNLATGRFYQSRTSMDDDFGDDQKSIKHDAGVQGLPSDWEVIEQEYGLI